MNAGGARWEPGKQIDAIGGTDARYPMAALADQIRAASGAEVCIVAWRVTGRHDSIAASANFSIELASAIFALVEYEYRRSGARLDAVLQLPPERLRSVTAETFATGAIVTVAKDSGLRTTVILISHPEDAPRDAVLRLAVNSAAAIAMRAEAATSRDFWRGRAAALGEEVAAGRDGLAETIAGESERAGAVAEALALSPQKRFAGLGKLFARLANADAWIVAIRVNHRFRMEAASAPSRKLAEITDDGPWAECLREQRSIIRTADLRHECRDEDRFFSKFPSYICLPFSHAVIAFASRPAPSAKTLARLEQLARALDPVVERWLAEAENERLQELVRTLGLRMFTAIDNERQRIARDLHDDQAQLLTAARLALETDPHQARAILKQLDEGLRKRVRELRPATLGSAKLVDAIRSELDRLATAGIDGRLLGSSAIASISRRGQELCYQILHEAFSNILRHSAAHRVTVTISSIDDKVLLTVEDDGVGPENAANSSRSGQWGMGLTGMTERLQLMGGTLQLARINDRTRLTADFPQF